MVRRVKLGNAAEIGLKLSKSMFGAPRLGGRVPVHAGPVG